MSLHNIPLRSLLGWADDACVLLGVILAGVGVYAVCPVATWFYSGAVLVALGYLLGRVK